MKNILVPIDFSRASLNVISYAAFIAGKFESKILLLHVYADTSDFEEKETARVYNSYEELDAAQEDYLKKKMEHMVKKYTISTHIIVQKGDVGNTITEVANQNNADLIIMGMKGKGESHSVFGSTATGMINKTSTPLLVIPSHVNNPKIENIVLASDFNQDDLLNRFQILQTIISKCEPLIHILNVQKENAELNPKMIADKMKIDRKWSKHNYSFNIIKRDSVEAGIKKFLNDNPADILIMVAGRSNFIKEILGMSRTKKMIQKTKIPLLILNGSNK